MCSNEASPGDVIDEDVSIEQKRGYPHVSQRNMHPNAANQLLRL